MSAVPETKAIAVPPALLPDVHRFLVDQTKRYGANVEVEPGFWIVFAVHRLDAAAREQVTALLAVATFPWETGETEDDEWNLYYVATADRADALDWLEDQRRFGAGEPRLPGSRQRQSVEELLATSMPHRVAQHLAEQHQQRELSAGCISDRRMVRGLLDRLHAREPLYYAAFHTLLQHHLIDLVVLLREILPEDIDLANETVRSSLSRDPFLRSRQTAAAEIRQLLTRFHIINALDQQKNTSVPNPYAAALEIARVGSDIVLTVDGMSTPTPWETFVAAIRTIRLNIYRGGDLAHFDTQVPWMSSSIALSFRFIKHKLETHREFAALDGLYMAERAAIG